jgi:hypothetical protein
MRVRGLRPRLAQRAAAAASDLHREHEVGGGSRCRKSGTSRARAGAHARGYAAEHLSASADYHLGTTSIYLQGIDPEEIITAVRARRAPMMSASAGLRP